jgi:hypothetical protein
MLAMGQYYLRRGESIEINWFGRISVFPIMGAIFWAMVFQSIVWDAMFVAGVALAAFATVIYVRTGLSRLTAT